MSRHELAVRLARDGGAPDAIAALLDEFETLGWLSDRRFAAAYIADHRARDGAVKIAHALRQRGVADTLIDELLAHLDADAHDNEVARARAVWQKKFAAAPTSAAERAKHMRFLAGRGFSSQTIRRVLAGDDD